MKITCCFSFNKKLSSSLGIVSKYWFKSIPVSIKKFKSITRAIFEFLQLEFHPNQKWVFPLIHLGDFLCFPCYFCKRTKNSIWSGGDFMIIHEYIRSLWNFKKKILFEITKIKLHDKSKKVFKKIVDFNGGREKVWKMI